MLAVELAERAAHHADEDCLAAAEGELLAVHVMTAGLAVMLVICAHGLGTFCGWSSR